MKKITVTLNEHDEEGLMVDTHDMEITLDSVSDIIDHAASLVLAHRDDKPIGEAIDELADALQVAGVIDAPKWRLAAERRVKATLKI